ncbi:MAG: LPS export ABC transporter periplasmic protein LptC [Treponema sp.]|jgi:lipopolysaccharide export system protein LptA|nr:LPS export ABC transporter periplasmic protein LptC [Treponema sp.]
MSGKAGSKSDTTTLTGTAYVKTESMEISADTIELSGDNFRYIHAEGNVTGKDTDSGMTFTCATLEYDRTTKIASLQNTVHMEDPKNDIEAEAQKMEYNQAEDIAVLQIEVRLKQKNNVCTCAHAIYRKKEQTLEMNGNPQVVQGDDTFRAQTILLNLTTQELSMDGRVSGSIQTDSGDSGGKKGDTTAKTGTEHD